jgi:hypothetical protein
MRADFRPRLVRQAHCREREIDLRIDGARADRKTEAAADRRGATPKTRSSAVSTARSEKTIGVKPMTIHCSVSSADRLYLRLFAGILVSAMRGAAQAGLVGQVGPRDQF